MPLGIVVLCPSWELHHIQKVECLFIQTKLLNNRGYIAAC